MIVRTQRHMTITEAHPFHGMSDDGRRVLDMGGNAEVWEEFSARCPLCRKAMLAHGHPRFTGTNPRRQSVGDPGHCERCVEVGHVLAHPSLGCGDVGCEEAHGPGDPL